MSSSMQTDGPRFVIRPPTTIDDDGSPTDNIVNDAKRILQLIQDERHLCAEGLHRNVEDRVKSHTTNSTNNTSSSSAPSSSRLLRFGGRRHSKQQQQQEGEKRRQEYMEAKKILEQNHKLLEKLKDHCRLFHNAKQELNVNDDWTLAQTLFGVTTYYRREDDGSLSIKLEGKLEGVPLFEQVSVLREVDLHHRWAPFVSSSLTVAHLEKLDTVGWFVVGLPQFGLMRDACFRAIGCDCMTEDGSILLVGQGIADRPEDKPNDIGKGSANNDNEREKNSTEQIKERKLEKTRADEGPIKRDGDDRILANDPVLEELDLPEVPQRMGSGRMTIRKFNCIIHVKSPDSVDTKMIANVDPNLSFLPQSLLEFVMKKLCGVLLAKLQGAAKRVLKDPVRNPHARKMRLERDFYQEWLMPKFQGQCKSRGWIMPPVSAFNLTGEQLEQSQTYEEQQRAKGNSRIFHSLDDLEKMEDQVGSSRSRLSEPAPYGSPNAYVESDTVSDISMNSTSTMRSVWRNNPIATYLRDLEEKTQRRKDAEIAKSRAKAAKRLKPKILDPAKQSRLAELRAAKNRRKFLDYYRSGSTLSGSGGSSSSADNLSPNITAPGTTRPPSLIVTDRSLTDSQRLIVKEGQREDLAIFWTEHGTLMRVFVTSGFVVILFTALYKDRIFGIYPKQILFVLREEETGPWYLPFARDAGVILYMGVLALIHFFLCYVSLMYAFSALQLGGIAGRRAKMFYSRNVHLMVGLASGSMVALGVVKAILLVVIRLCIWQVVRLADAVAKTISEGWQGVWVELRNILALIADEETGHLAVETMDAVWEASSTILNAVLGTCFVALRGSHELLIESNIVGRVLKVPVVFVYHIVAEMYRLWNGFVNDIVDRHEGRLETLSWREDAFQTTRSLLLYSAVFLLALLLLFILSAKSSHNNEEQYDMPTDTPQASPAHTKGSASPHADSNNDSSFQITPSSASAPRPAPLRNRVPTFESIEEEPSHFNETGGIKSEASYSKPKKERRGLRLRQRKKKASATDVGSGFHASRSL